MRPGLLMVLTLTACSRRTPPAPPPPSVQLETVAPTQVVDSDEYLATLRSHQTAQLHPDVAGRVTEILVHAGEHVTARQRLLRIDPGPQSAAVAQASQQRAAQVAALRLAEKNLARTQALVTAGALPRQDLDTARATVASARASVAALGAGVTASRAQLRYYDVTAPTAGTIGDVPVNVGDRVTTDTLLTTVIDSAVLEANLAIPVARAGQLRPGMEVELLDARSDVIGRGVIGFVSPQVDPQTQSVLVKARVDNPAGRLRVDQVVRARVVWGEHPGFTVPALAVVRLGAQAFVFVARPQDGRLIARQQPVELGPLTSGRYVVTRGLQRGDRVITSDVQKLRDRAPVAAAPAAATAPSSSSPGPSA